MRRLLLACLFVIFCSNYSKAQFTTNLEWQKCMGGSAADTAWSVCLTDDGGYIALGGTSSTNGDVTGNRGSSDVWLVKFSGGGSVEWKKTLGSNNIDYGRSIKQTKDGGYIIAGYASANNGNVSGAHGKADFWIVKLDALDSLIWQKSFGGTNFDYAYSIQETYDGGFIIAGETSSTTGNVTGAHGGIDYWVVKLNSIGAIEWQKAYGGTNDEAAYSVQQTTDSGYIVLGYSYSSDGDIIGNSHHGTSSDYWLLKITSTGFMEWQQSIGGWGDDYGRSVQQTFDGNYILAGWSNSIDGDVSGNLGNDDYWVVKVDNLGNYIWDRSSGGSDYDKAYSIQQTADSGFIVAGSSNSIDGDITGNHGNNDFWIIKLDIDGNLKMQKSLGGTANDCAYSVQQTPEGGYIVAGISNSLNGDVTGNHAGSDDFWVVKLSGVVATEEKTNSLSAFNVNPNPVSQSANISFSLNQSENVTVKIYDITGREVKSLFHGDLTNGTHRFAWNIADNSGALVNNGIYFATIETASGTYISKRLAVIK